MALFDRQNVRGLMVEWTTVSLLLLLAYTVLVVAALGFVLGAVAKVVVALVMSGILLHAGMGTAPHA